MRKSPLRLWKLATRRPSPPSLNKYFEVQATHNNSVTLTEWRARFTFSCSLQSTPAVRGVPRGGVHQAAPVRDHAGRQPHAGGQRGGRGAVPCCAVCAFVFTLGSFFFSALAFEAGDYLRRECASRAPVLAQQVPCSPVTGMFRCFCDRGHRCMMCVHNTPEGVVSRSTRKAILHTSHAPQPAAGALSRVRLFRFTDPCANPQLRR